tara:strand:+ start:345 stop:554 length:210 start_codon:yes stop_codon:yes gene_type:complete
VVAVVEAMQLPVELDMVEVAVLVDIEPAQHQYQIQLLLFKLVQVVRGDKHLLQHLHKAVMEETLILEHH